MAAYELANGELVDADPANPQHAQWLQAQKAKPYNPVMGGAKALVGGLAEGVARLPALGGDLINLGLDSLERHAKPKWMESPGYKDFRAAHKGSGWLDEGLAKLGSEFYRPKTELEKYINTGAQGLSGGAAVAGARVAAPTLRALPLAAPTLPPELIRSTAMKAAPVAAGAGGVGAVTGQGLMDLTDPTDPLIGLAGNILGGGASGWAMARTPKAMRVLSEAGQSQTPDTWRQAAENLAKFRATGVKSATLGEAFPDSVHTKGANPYLDITKEALSQSRGNELVRKVADRPADLQNLTNQALDAVGPPIGSDVAAANAEGAARGRLDQFRKARGAEYTKRIQGAPPMPEDAVIGLRDTMRALASRQQNSLQKEALEAVADTLMQPNKEVRTVMVRVKEPGKPAKMVPKRVEVEVPKTDVQALMVELKALRDSLEYNPMSASTPKKLDAHAFRQAYDMVDNFIREVAPDHYPRAESGFKRFSKNLITPAEKGPLGVMAGRSPADNQVVPFSRMESLVSRQAPDAIPQTVASLDKGAPGTDLPQQVARALLQQRVRGGGNDLGTKLAGGEPGSLGAQQTEALVSAIGKNTKAWQDPVDVLQLLGRLEGGGSGGGQRAQDMGTSPGTAAANPLQDIRLRMRLGAQNANYGQAARLLANPTPENLAKLQKLAQSDPSLRLWLGMGGGLSSANTGVAPEEQK